MRLLTVVLKAPLDARYGSQGLAKVHIGVRKAHALKNAVKGLMEYVLEAGVTCTSWQAVIETQHGTY